MSGMNDGDSSAAAAGIAPARHPKMVVVIATIGRPDILAKNITNLSRQTRPPDRVIVSATCGRDLAGIAPSAEIEAVFCRPGLAHQRNRALARIPHDTDIIVFFDDDFVPHPAWLAVAERYFETHPEVVALTGHLVADGVKGPGLSFEDGLTAVEGRAHDIDDYCIDGYSPYGCNMAFRAEAIAGLRFDERLVLYSWLEDRDFGGALSRRGGRLVKISQAIGAHLGIKAARISGRRLGYSQIVNPIYLHRKGTMTTASLCVHLARNLLSNASRAFVPEAHIDRAGRLSGNMRGIWDVVTGQAMPERAEWL